MKLWRTEECVRSAAPKAEVTGCCDLLEHQGLSSIAPVAELALHVDYNNPTHQKQFDFIGKLKGPPAAKQLYKQHLPPPAIGQPPPESRWSLLAVARWPPHTYNFHPYPLDSIQRALVLQPGACSLPEVALGEPVGPLRVEPAAPAAAAAGAQSVGARSNGSGGSAATGAAVGSVAGSGGDTGGGPGAPAARGRGRRGGAGTKRTRAKAASAEPSASELTGDTSYTQDTIQTSNKRQRGER